MIVKICGITNKEDALEALAVGADWIGLNFVGGVRELTWKQASPILDAIDDPSRVVALVTSTAGVIEDNLLLSLQGAGVRRLQLYGEVLPETIRHLRQKHFESITTFPLGNEVDLKKVCNFFASCQGDLPDYILVDASVAGQLGGTGRQANWSLLRKAIARGKTNAWPPLLLAGGLTLESVAQAIAQVNPMGVDVSSGVEKSPGIKDTERMRAFVNNALATA